MISTKTVIIRLVILILCSSGSIMLHAQNSNDAREVTNKYFIKDAFVVQKPGTILPSTSVIVEDGIIKSVGKGLKVPFDAKIIDADSLYLYAAFIDACSDLGFPKEKKEERKDVNDPGNPSMEEAGITPHVTVRDKMGTEADKSLKSLKEIGFGFAHIVPKGRMLPGMGSLISTGEVPLSMAMINENISQFAQFRTARGIYPGTTIAVMSKFRDLYKNAEIQSTYSKKYASNPSNLNRPNASKEIIALAPMVNNTMPVFFRAPKVKDVNRAIILQKELGFDLILTGVKQGWPLMSKVKENNQPIILSLDLPEKIEDEEDKKDDKDAEAKDQKKKKKKDDKETEALKIRKKKAHDDYVGQAAAFQANGLKIAFSSLDTKTKDIMPNIRRMIAAGLSEEAALEALTTAPAEIFGINNIAGTVEKGKIANLFITEKSYFDEASKVRYILTDGKLSEIKKKEAKVDESASKKLLGEWTYEIQTPDMLRTGTMIVEDDGSLTIKLDGDDEPGEFIEADEIELDDDNLTFDVTTDQITFSVSVVIEGDAFEGTVSVGEFGTFPMKGAKSQGPKY